MSDYATLHLFDPRVMRKHMDVPIAAAEKRTQDPTNHADNDCTPERAPETFHMKPPDEVRHNEEHQTINDENEKPQRKQDNRRAQYQ